MRGVKRVSVEKEVDWTPHIDLSRVALGVGPVSHRMWEDQKVAFCVHAKACHLRACT